MYISYMRKCNHFVLQNFFTFAVMLYIIWARDCIYFSHVGIYLLFNNVTGNASNQYLLMVKPDTLSESLSEFSTDSL